MPTHTEQFTSLNLSKWLSKHGCTLESGYAWVGNGRGVTVSPILSTKGQADILNLDILYPAYDYLWDICIRHAKAFWGEGFRKFNIEDLDNKKTIKFGEEYQFHTFTLLSLLQQNKQAEVEEYIKTHSLFNK